MDAAYDEVNVLGEITEGMEVLGANGDRIGKVKYVQMPSIQADPSLADFPYDLQKKDIPTEMAYRLLRFGFISINAGWLAKDRIAIQDQIDFVSDGKVHLRAVDEQLSKV